MVSGPPPGGATVSTTASRSDRVRTTSSPPAAAVLESASTVGQLREQLRRAIAGEQFELAAQLRDKLRAAEGDSAGATTRVERGSVGRA